MAFFGPAPQWWTWRTSAHASVASFLMLWVLIFTAPFLGPLLWLVLAIRMATSTAQMLLNWRLRRVAPIEGRTRTDWLLFGLTYIMACVAAQIGRSTGDLSSPLILVLIAVPYSGIELRAIGRSHRAAAAAGERLTQGLAFYIKADESSAG